MTAVEFAELCRDFMLGGLLVEVFGVVTDEGGLVESGFYIAMLGAFFMAAVLMPLAWQEED